MMDKLIGSFNYGQSAGGNFIKKDGSTPFSGNQSMGDHKLTDVSNATVDTDAVNLGQVKALQPKVISGVVEATGNIFGGNVTKTANNQLTVKPCSCLDSKLSTQLYTIVNTVVNIPPVMNNTYHLAIVKLVSDGSMTIRVYSSEAAMTSDNTVSAYRWIDFWQTNNSSVCKDGVTVDGVKWWGRFVDNTISGMVVVQSGINTPLDLSAYLPVSRCSYINIGCNTAIPTLNIAISSVAGTAQCQVAGMSDYSGSGDISEWGGGSYSSNEYLPVFNDIIYWGGGTWPTAQLPVTSSVQLAVHSIKLRR